MGYSKLTPDAREALINAIRGDPGKRDKQTNKRMLKKAIESNKSFKDFLERNHAYGRYIRNVLHQNKTMNAIDAIHFGNDDAHFIINQSLVWGHTKEGYNYWVDLAFKKQ